MTQVNPPYAKRKTTYHITNLALRITIFINMRGVEIIIDFPILISIS